MKMIDIFKVGNSRKNNNLPNWRNQEIQAAKSSFYKGYKVMQQKPSHTLGKRADIFAQNPHDSRDRRMGEVKYKIKASKRDVDQAFNYKKYPYCAREVALHYTRNTEIPKNVRDYANEKNIRILRTGITKVKEPTGPLGLLLFREYKR